MIVAAPADLSEEEKARNFKGLQIWDPVASLWKSAVSITIDGSNWTGQEVKFYAPQDTGIEGRRFAFINHKIDEMASTDASYFGVQILSPKVQIDDDDRDGVVITPTDGNNTVLEGAAGEGFGDSFDVVLTQAPSAPVKVQMSMLGSPNQVTLSRSVIWFDNDNDANAADGELWSIAQTINVTAVDDTTLEGFHTEFIAFDVTSADVDVHKTLASGDVVMISGDPTTVGVDGFLKIDGDFDVSGVQDIPLSKPTSYVLLPHRPEAGTVSIRINGVLLDGSGADRRFDVSGNTVSFLTCARDTRIARRKCRGGLYVPGDGLRPNTREGSGCRYLR